MGRKYNLNTQANSIFKKMKSGAHETRLKRQREIKLAINDLIALGIAPAHLSHITMDHIHALIHYWSQQSLTSVTIQNKVSMLRRFLMIAQPALEIPASKDLPIPKKTLESAHKRWEEIHRLFEKASACLFNPISQSILAFQIHFGLTKNESIGFNTDFILKESSLLIGRSLASNGKDRYIPITTLEQEKAIHNRKTILGTKNSLTKILKAHLATSLYDAELWAAEINPKTPFRYLYIQKRYQELLKYGSEHESLGRIQVEMSISQRSTIEKMVW
jgi:hypothetical protein